MMHQNEASFKGYPLIRAPLKWARS